MLTQFQTNHTLESSSLLSHTSSGILYTIINLFLTFWPIQEQATITLTSRSLSFPLVLYLYHSLLLPYLHSLVWFMDLAFQASWSFAVHFHQCCPISVLLLFFHLLLQSVPIVHCHCLVIDIPLKILETHPLLQELYLVPRSYLGLFLWWHWWLLGILIRGGLVAWLRWLANYLVRWYLK